MRKLPRERVLEAVAAGERTWDELREASGLNDERLGLLLVRLFDERMIWTGQKGGTRVYGLERRGTPTPRFPHLLRRSTERVWRT